MSLNSAWVSGAGHLRWGNYTSACLSYPSHWCPLPLCSYPSHCGIFFVCLFRGACCLFLALWRPPRLQPLASHNISCTFPRGSYRVAIASYLGFLTLFPSLTHKNVLALSTRAPVSHTGQLLVPSVLIPGGSYPTELRKQHTPSR